MAAHQRQGLVFGDPLQVVFDEPVLHPVLAHLAGFTVGDQLVGVQRHPVVQVVFQHHLDGLALGTLPVVLLNGQALQGLFRHEAVAVDAAAGFQFV